ESLVAAVEKFKKTSKMELSVKIDTDNYLPAEITGGVELFSKNGKIKVSNTLESRLEMISRQSQTVSIPESFNIWSLISSSRRCSQRFEKCCSGEQEPQILGLDFPSSFKKSLKVISLARKDGVIAITVSWLCFLVNQ
ncbi:putative V-type proton ATPase subunit E, partial [Apostichopus japonicus]